MPLSLKKKGCSFHEELTIVLNMRVSGVDNEYCTVLRQGNYGIYTVSNGWRSFESVLFSLAPSQRSFQRSSKANYPQPFSYRKFHLVDLVLKKANFVSFRELALLFNDHSELSRKSLELILISLNLNRFLNVKYVVVLNQRGFTNRSKTTSMIFHFSDRSMSFSGNGLLQFPSSDRYYFWHARGTVYSNSRTHH